VVAAVVVVVVVAAEVLLRYILSRRCFLLNNKSLQCQIFHRSINISRHNHQTLLRICPILSRV
jgi:hypothetical protein